MAFNLFPYTNFHKLNLDWVLKTVQTMYEQVSDALQRVNTAVQSITDCVKVTAQNFSAAEKAQARTNIGAAATTDIPNVSDVVRTSPQTLNNAAKAQARTNIGAAATTDIPNVSDVVRTSPQTLNNEAKAQARTNIGAAATTDIPNVSDVVRTSPQALATAEKNTARSNIGAAASADIPNVADVVRTSVQTLSAAEQTQARSNIGAAAAADIPDVSDVVRTSPQTLSNIEKAYARTNIQAASTADTAQIRNQTIRFIEEDGNTPATVEFPPVNQDQIDTFRFVFALLKKISPEAWYSISLFGQDVGSDPGWPRVRLERVEDGNGGAYFKITQRASLDSASGNVDCRLSGVASPVDASDAVNKAYVDALFASRTN